MVKNNSRTFLPGCDYLRERQDVWTNGQIQRQIDKHDKELMKLDAFKFISRMVVPQTEGQRDRNSHRQTDRETEIRMNKHIIWPNIFKKLYLFPNNRESKNKWAN